MYIEELSFMDWVILIIIGGLLITSLVSAIGEAWNKQKQKHERIHNGHEKEDSN